MMEDPEPLPGLYERVQATAEHLRKSLASELQYPKVAIVCGSGLGGLADTINPEPRVEIPYKDVPGFAVSTAWRNLVPGHAGKLVFGTIGRIKTPVMLLVGRAHFYEGHAMAQVTFATRVCKLLGVDTMIVTNAAGGLNEIYSVGDIVMLNDHLNLAGLVGINPLIGPNDPQFGPRFPPLSDAYNLHLRRLTHNAWSALHPTPSRTLHEGIYAFVAGPTYETRAECRMLRLLGADVVGMSTVPEIIVARHCGIRVLAFSLITNKAVLENGVRGDAEVLSGMSAVDVDDFLSMGRANHEEVLEAGRAAAEDMQALVKAILEDLYSS